jgi:hypothetical protein
MSADGGQEETVMSPTIVVTLVLTMMTAGQQYERNMPMDSMGQCLSEATRVLNEAAKGPVETSKDAAEIGAGCVITIDPGHPA